MPRPRPLHSGSSSRQPALAIGGCLMFHRGGARCWKRLRVGFVCGVRLLSQQVFQLLCQPTLSTTNPSRTLEYNKWQIIVSTNVRLTISYNISIISYIQKNIQYYFQQGLLRGAWGVEGLLRGCWGVEGWWKGWLLPILGRLLRSFAFLAFQ